MLDWFVALIPPVIVPADGTDQLYKVPAGTTPLTASVGVTVNCTPLHVTVVISVMVALGLTVTVTVNDAPVQTPLNGVTIYVADCAVLTGLTSVP